MRPSEPPFTGDSASAVVLGLLGGPAGDGEKTTTLAALAIVPIVASLLPVSRRLSSRRSPPRG